MRVLRSVTALLAASLMLAGAANAANMFMKISDVPGDSAEYSGDQIEVLSWSWGETNDSAAKRPTDNGAGIVHVTLKRGFAGRSAVRSIYDGKREIPALILTTQERGKTVEYKLERCFIKSWSTSGDADDRPTEEIAFYYNKISH
ncbi:hypothetical protein [Hyphococcus sp.]|uniref:hypothetical protein n=1 Tax=Hyphococcus sp. TaxID=2038636 RepID=UPI0020850E77|nr:MAG: hypothetical protein DHS20C04_19020 [Marinicaulis sp.]